MAKVMFARLCREIKKNGQGRSYSLVGSFAHIKWVKGPVGFVCVVYWEKANETFHQSFALTDESGNILDETPSNECVLTRQGENISTAFFYASLPQAGCYYINVFQNGVRIESIPLQVMETPQISDSRSAPFESAAQS